MALLLDSGVFDEVAHDRGATPIGLASQIRQPVIGDTIQVERLKSRRRTPRLWNLDTLHAHPPICSFTKSLEAGQAIFSTCPKTVLSSLPRRGINGYVQGLCGINRVAGAPASPEAGRGAQLLRHGADASDLVGTPLPVEEWHHPPANPWASRADLHGLWHQHGGVDARVLGARPGGCCPGAGDRPHLWLSTRSTTRCSGPTPRKGILCRLLSRSAEPRPLLVGADFITYTTVLLCMIYD